MKNCHKKLKELIQDVVLPDIEDRIDEIFETIANDKIADDALKTELESMHELRDEFKSILSEIQNNELQKDECTQIYEDIMEMISEQE